jgi:putative ABC transport system substrate-binding protein
MNARAAIFGLTAMSLLGGYGAHAEEVARVAWLGTGTIEGSAEFVAAFREGMKEQGLAEGKHYVLDARYADNHYERFPVLVQDLLTRGPSVIMVVTVASVRAAQRVTRTVPIVMISTTDPVGSGLVKSLSHPGGNTTGLGNMAEDVAEKYVQLFRELRPRGRRLGVLINPSNPSSRPVLEKIRNSARHQGITIHAIEFVGAHDLEQVFRTIARDTPDALTLIADNSYLDRRAELGALAVQHRIPVFGFAPDFADAGCAAGFGSPRRDLFRRSAVYVRKLLDGANPADLPVELPVTFELVVNRRTTNALGIAIPKTVLTRADRVIQ